MKGWREIGGTCLVQIVSASTADMLTAVSKAKIDLWNVQEVDELTVRVSLNRSQYPLLEALLRKRGETCSVTSQKGLYWMFRGLVYRPVLILGALLLLIGSIYLPTRVLFVEVEGNNVVSPYQIQEAAEKCGIRMWASRAQVRSEKMKNRLLMAIPQLKWAGINTKGCVAIISVTEREVPTQEKPSVAPLRIVAKEDGVIQSVTVTKGSALCVVGQAVSQGQVLVSPYTDCGISIKMTQVEAEIMAVTNRRVRAIKPLPETCKYIATEKLVDVGLLIGKNMINLYKGSGNYGAVCDKIYEEKYLTLPGGFRLPVALVLQKTICYDTDAPLPSGSRETSGLDTVAQEYLKTLMVSGKILSRNTNKISLEDRVILEGNYSCLEMIGKLQNEEIIQNE